MDDCSYTAYSVAAWASQQLHDGWVRAHPVGCCNCCCTDSRNSGAEIVTLLQKTKPESGIRHGIAFLSVVLGDAKRLPGTTQRLSP